MFMSKHVNNMFMSRHVNIYLTCFDMNMLFTYFDLNMLLCVLLSGYLHVLTWTCYYVCCLVDIYIFWHEHVIMCTVKWILTCFDNNTHNNMFLSKYVNKMFMSKNVNNMFMSKHVNIYLTIHIITCSCQNM
jgi:hypothetical protein